MNKLNKECFIERSNIIHKNKYDYEKFIYINGDVKGMIICPIHGDFEQLPKSHLVGKGCKKCAVKKISQVLSHTKELFVKKAIQVHGNKYDYQNFVYINQKTRGIITCSVHGDFYKFPAEHLRGEGCPKCSGYRKKTTEEVIEQAVLIHGNKYNYNKLLYINNDAKVVITCPIHGDFEQLIKSHLQGHGCAKCSGYCKKRTEDIVQQAKSIYGNKYDYKKFIYVNTHTKATIICSIHGEFHKIPIKHLKGEGCPKCGGTTKASVQEVIYKILNLEKEYGKMDDKKWTKLWQENKIEKYYPKYLKHVKL